METQITQEDLEQITAGIRQKYSRVADSPEGQFRYPTGRAGLEALKYDATLTDKLPDEVAASYCGVGNPFSLGTIRRGDAVLDIGCGAGVDTILSAMMTGPEGKAVGVDIVPEMLLRAETNLKRMDLRHVTFQAATGEHLPFPDGHFDVVISNGVINLIPDKDATMREVLRVLKVGGLLMIADQVMAGGTPKSLKERLSSWFRWEGGAIPGMDFLALMEKVGFADAKLVTETGLNSTPKTRGVLIRARKPEKTDP